MDYKAALARLKTLEVEGTAELASAFEGEVERLNNKNFELIGEKRTATSRATALEAALTGIGKALGLGDDPETLLAETPAKAAALATEAGQLRTDKAALEAAKAEAEGRAKGLERRGKLATVAAAVGADLTVLERLFGDQIDAIAVGEDGSVKLGETPLREHVEADPVLQKFAPALFPQGGVPGPWGTPPLPGGSPRGSQGQQSNPLADYLAKTYPGLKPAS